MEEGEVDVALEVGGEPGFEGGSVGFCLFVSVLVGYESGENGAGGDLPDFRFR